MTRIFWTALLGVFIAGSAVPAFADKPPLSLHTFIYTLDHVGREALNDMPDQDPLREAFHNLLTAAVAGSPDLAAAASAANYSIVPTVEAGVRYTVLADPDEIGPTIALSHAPQRDLIISAPHGRYDRVTDIQSAITLSRLGARVLILAGAHRCASQTDTECDGRSGVCGGGYKTSDGAHNTFTRFHQAHVFFADRWPNSIVVQLHGFALNGTDAWAVLSDGSEERRPGDSALTGKVRDGVRRILGQDNRAVSCQDPNDDAYDYRPLCARTNVQGRYLNGSTNACRLGAAAASGRFLHVEQSWDIRHIVSQYWPDIGKHPKGAAIIDAIAAAVPCTLRACGK